MTERRFIPCCDCGAPFLADQPWKKRCIPCWKKSKGYEEKAYTPPPRQPQYKQSVGTIPEDMLTRLIRLCHPDRHGNSEAANVATTWLLELRGRR